MNQRYASNINMIIIMNIIFILHILIDIIE